MKKNALLITLLISLAGPASASDRHGAHFLRFDTGARPAAMAGAFTAVPGGISSLWINPGSLAASEYTEAQLTHNEAGEGIRRGAAAFLHPSKKLRGASALSIGYYGVGGIDAYTPEGIPDGAVGASAFTVQASYAPRLSGPFYPGASIKFIGEKLDSYAASALAADLGLFWDTPWEGVTAGAAALNIGSGLTFIDRRSPLPFTWRAGAAFTHSVSETGFTAAADVISPGGRNPGLALGGEVSFYRFVHVRAGWLSSDDLSGGLRLGGGIVTPNVSFDYAWLPRGGFDASHMLTAGFRFGHKYSETQLEANIREHFERGERLYQAGRILEAYREFRNLLLVAPRHAQAGEYVSRIEVSMESMEARKELENIFNKGVEHFNNGNLTAARADFETVLLLDGNHPGALSHIDSIENRFREVAATMIDRAQAYFDRAEFEKAAEEISKALAIVPDDERALQLHGTALDRIREMEERRTALRREQEERIRQRNIENLVAQGNTRFGRGRWLSAVESYRGVLELDPGNTEASGKIGEAYTANARQLKSENNLPEALEFYIKAEKFNARGIKEEKTAIKSRMAELAVEYNRLGLVEYSKGELKKAESLWEDALRHNPALSEARENLSRVRRELR